MDRYRDDFSYRHQNGGHQDFQMNQERRGDEMNRYGRGSDTWRQGRHDMEWGRHEQGGRFDDRGNSGRGDMGDYDRDIRGRGFGERGQEFDRHGIAGHERYGSQGRDLQSQYGYGQGMHGLGGQHQHERFGSQAGDMGHQTGGQSYGFGGQSTPGTSYGYSGGGFGPQHGQHGGHQQQWGGGTQGHQQQWGGEHQHVGEFSGTHMGTQNYPWANQTTQQRKRGRFAGVGPKGYKRSDETVKEDVCRKLWEHPEIDASEIHVEVKNGEITLTGTVDSRRTRDLVEDICDNLIGVTDVNNQVRVKRQREDEMRAGGTQGTTGNTTGTTTTSTTNRNQNQ